MKKVWDGTTLLAPVPVVLATVGTMEKSNIVTIAWTGIVNSQPPMTYISVRKERYSHDLIMENMEFVINLVTEELCRTTDTIGVKSGRDIDKFKEFKLTKLPSTKVAAPLIDESPISLECKVKQVIDLGSHDMFLAEIVAVDLDEELLDEKEKLHISRANLVTYAHGEYFSIGKKIGKFGFSVKKPDKKKKYQKR
ncbi:MAG: flavin reductase family protein [Clostridia bacterium]